MLDRLVLLCFSLILIFGQLQAQPADDIVRHRDSLYHQIKQLDNPQLQIQELLELSFFWSDYNPVEALMYLQEAEKILGKTRNTTFYKGILSFYRAAINFEINPTESKRQYLEAEHYLKEVNDNRKVEAIRYRARGWGSYGALLQRDGQMHEYADILLNKVLPLAKEIQDSVLLGNNYQNVAMTLMNLQEHEKAEQYYALAQSILDKTQKGKEAQLTLYVNRARNALFVKDDLNVRLFLDHAFNTLKHIPHSVYKASYHNLEGNYWARQKNYDKSNKHFETALSLARAQDDEDMIATILFDQYEAYYSGGQFELAISKLLEVASYVEQKQSLRNKQLVFYKLAHTYSKLGQGKQAIEWFERYKLLTDTIFANRSDERILELEKKYQTAEKENELLRLKEENQQNQIKLNRTRMIIGIVISSSIIFAILTLFIYNSLKNKKYLAEQKERLLFEELKSNRQQEKLSVFNAMLQGEERERSRIARDLHDGLGGMLASVKLKLSAVANKKKGESAENRNRAMSLDPIIHQLDHSVNELRRVARNMMPESLLYMSLEASLQDLCNMMAHQDLQIHFQATGLRNNYEHSFLITVYRIVQELLSNSVKHSGADQIWVQCLDADEVFNLTIEDNGKGFDPNKEINRQKGMGISNIQNRIQLLDGHLEIDAAEGRGASFHIQLKHEN